jgi:hypothetical protein
MVAERSREENRRLGNSRFAIDRTSARRFGMRFAFA